MAPAHCCTLPPLPVQVATDLPSKREHVIRCRLSAWQERLYSQITQVGGGRGWVGGWVGAGGLGREGEGGGGGGIWLGVHSCLDASHVWAGCMCGRS
jgi:hypothetical protein